MATLIRVHGYVFRKGSRTSDNFTPRPDRDLDPLPGQAPGLSTRESVELTHGEKAQRIELSRLPFPLRGISDDVEAGGEVGHVVIAPVGESEAVDHERLKEWAASRGTGRQHPFTQFVLDAIVEEVRGE